MYFKMSITVCKKSHRSKTPQTVMSAVKVILLFDSKLSLTLGSISVVLCLRVGMLVVFPDFLCLRSPFLCKLVALAAKHICRFFANKIGGLDACSFADVPELFRVFKHGTGSEVVVVEGLVVSESHKQGISETFKQSMSSDIGVGEMNEYARLHIAC